MAFSSDGKGEHDQHPEELKDEPLDEVGWRAHHLSGVLKEER